MRNEIVYNYGYIGHTFVHSVIQYVFPNRSGSRSQDHV